MTRFVEVENRQKKKSKECLNYECIHRSRSWVRERRGLEVKIKGVEKKKKKRKEEKNSKMVDGERGENYILIACATGADLDKNQLLARWCDKSNGTLA